MWDAYVAGGRAAGRCVGLIVVLYIIGAAVVAVFGTAVWLTVEHMLDGALATRTLLTDLDANVFLDLIVHKSDSLRGLGLAGLVVAGGALILYVWLNAALIVAVAGAVNVRTSLRRGWGLFPTFVSLWGLALAAVTVLLGLDWLTVRLVTQWAAARGTGPPPLLVAAVGGAAAVLGLLVLVAAHDHARIRAAATGGGAIRAWAWGWRFVWQRRTEALPLVGLLALTAAAVWAVFGGLQWSVVPTTATRVTLVLIAAQLAALARLVMRAWWFGAETALQRRAAGPAR